MKPLQINPVNVFISMFYCLLGVLSFIVLKIAVSQFMRQPQKQTGQMQQIKKKVFSSQAYLKQLNFSKIFLLTYFLKNTFIGSIIYQDKKYLLKQILIISCMAVCSLGINRYIFWAWIAGLSIFIASFIIFEILLVKLSSSVKLNEKSNQSQISSFAQEDSVMASHQIQINTYAQLSVEGKGLNCVNQPEKKISKDKKVRQPNLELLLITILGLTTEILICQSIFTLCLSVSNSGVLNLISLSIAIAIDQFCLRIGLGLISYLVCIWLHMTSTVNFFLNETFLQYCSEIMKNQLVKVFQEEQNSKNNNKITDFQNKKMQIQQNIFKLSQIENNFLEKPQELDIPSILKPQPYICNDQALLEQNFEQQLSLKAKPQQIKNYQNVTNNETNLIKKEAQKIYKQDSINYFEPYLLDVQIFRENCQETSRSNKKMKKFKKLPKKIQKKLKSDPHLYLPFQEHKTNRNPIAYDTKQFKSQFELSRQKFSINENNILRNIDVLDCVNDTIITEGQPEIGSILNEKNFNIKTMTIDMRPEIPPTARPNCQKRRSSEATINAKQRRKKSPYLADLSSIEIKRQNIKKLHKKKTNNENANLQNSDSRQSWTNHTDIIIHKQILKRINKNLDQQ